MRFRPRYSLLTLLVLTALVAGGVKLWYGPHWQELNAPTVLQLQELIRVRLKYYSPRSKPAYSYQYRNTWDGQEVVLFKCKYLMSQYRIDRQPTTTYPSTYDLILLFEEQLRTGLAKHYNEQVVCWISGKLSLVHDESEKRGIYGPGYVVTNKKRIFLTQLSELEPRSELQLVELETISNPDLRAEIARELAALPDLPKD